MKFGSITTGIVSDGLVLNMDAANRTSYPAQRTLATSESGSCYNTLDLSQSGSFIADPQFITEPISASCWGFDGIDDYIDTNASFDSDITLSAWINSDGTYTAWQNRFPVSIPTSHASIANGTLGRFYHGEGGIFGPAFQLYDNEGANFATYYIGLDFEGAGWKHCVWTYNDTTKAIYFYLNGVRQDWTKWGGTPSNVPYLTATGYSYNSDLKIGTNVGTYFFDGKVGNTQTYNRVLSPSDVLHNYNALKGRFT